MRLKKLVSFKGDIGDSFHVMKHGESVIVFHLNGVSCRRIDTDKTYSLENNLTGEHWSGIEEFITSKKNRAKTKLLADRFYDVEPWWF